MHDQRRVIVGEDLDIGPVVGGDLHGAEGGAGRELVTSSASVAMPTPSNAPVRRRLFCHNLANPSRSLPWGP
ncbi:hypothetical protein [Streptomyces rapamycinicus]|uniref:Uncharacterized protein n=1 Tax=Streptomyces rapamycinicus TaxID=1226757 RepID=A0ABR6LWI2_9ACTN|nr:hypothetical protein [Streptomyces rapamycinicus]AGP58975.1 hypothetical protein M271_37900 [Streptomyces rapamycinicus NRRL 5491]MBB4786696.1 hypothetical protein [Streptomyces rapamycinicus]